MTDVVCIDLDNGPALVDRMATAWDRREAVFVLDRRLAEPARRALLGALLPTVMCDAEGERPVQGRTTDEGDFLLVATSGSTGEPKIAVLTREAVAASAVATSAALGTHRSDRWFACLPPAHVGGLSVITRALLTGIPVDAVPRFTPEAYTDAAARGCTLTSLVATALARVDAGLYRRILVGGSAAPTPRPDNVIATYGMTETGGGVVYDGIALEGVEIDIRDGRIHLRAPMLLRSYRDAPAPIVDGWFDTGDAGEMVGGRLVVHGRIGDVIVSGGEKIWPEPLERCLLEHPSVAEVCVVGVDDATWGRAVHAVVVPAPGAAPDLASLAEHVRTRIAPHWAPKALHIASAIPRTSLGKPRRAEVLRSLGR